MLTDLLLSCRNILAGLASPLSGLFYNAACADPTRFLSKRTSQPNDDARYELRSLGGSPVIGIIIGVCTRCDLRSDPPPQATYHSITILPHRGIWERCGSFHCMNIGVEYMVGQVDEGSVSFQTYPKSEYSFL